MIITKANLKKIITEEISRTIDEAYLINEVNADVHATYGIDLTECMTLKEQLQIARRFNLKHSDFEYSRNLMTTCGFIKMSSPGKNKVNESVGILQLLGQGYMVFKTTKFWNEVVGFVADRYANQEFHKAVREWKKSVKESCQSAYDAANEIKKCVTGQLPPEEFEKLKSTQGVLASINKLSMLLKKIFSTIFEKFKSLLTFVAAAIKFKTLKPSAEQKEAAAPIAEKIVVLINLSLAATFIVPMLIGGGWVLPIVGAFFGALQIFGAVRKIKAINKLQSASTPEEAKQTLQQARQEALQNVMQEAA
mgnify:CR=1 FL=1